MKYTTLLLSGLLFVSACGKKEVAGASVSNPDEDGVILAIADEPMPPGLVKEEEFTMEFKEAKLKVTLPDRVCDGDMAMKEVKKSKVESISKGKYRFTVLEEIKTESTTMMGQKQPAKVTRSPIEGKPLIAEKGGDGVWKVALESGQATPEMEKEIAKLEKKLSKDEDTEVYGTIPRKIGDEWTVDGADMLGVEDGKGKIKLRLAGIEDHNGERCAKLTGSMDITGSPDKDTQGLKMRMAGDFVIFRSLEHRTDLSNELKGTIEVFGEMEPQPGMKMKMDMQGGMRATGSAKVSKSK